MKLVSKLARHHLVVSFLADAYATGPGPGLLEFHSASCCGLCVSSVMPSCIQKKTGPGYAVVLAPMWKIGQVPRDPIYLQELLVSLVFFIRPRVLGRMPVC